LLKKEKEDYVTSFLQVKGSDTATFESSFEAKDNDIPAFEEVSVVLGCHKFI